MALIESRFKPFRGTCFKFNDNGTYSRTIDHLAPVAAAAVQQVPPVQQAPASEIRNLMRRLKLSCCVLTTTVAITSILNLSVLFLGILSLKGHISADILAKISIGIGIPLTLINGSITIGCAAYRSNVRKFFVTMAATQLFLSLLLIIAGIQFLNGQSVKIESISIMMLMQTSMWFVFSGIATAYISYRFNNLLPN